MFEIKNQLITFEKETQFILYVIILIINTKIIHLYLNFIIYLIYFCNNKQHNFIA